MTPFAQNPTPHAPGPTAQAPRPMKRLYLLAIISFLSIPVVTVLAGVVFSAIDPEIAAGHPDYERNYRLLDMAKHLSLLAGLLLDLGLWILTCFFLLRSKGRSAGWLPLAILGPFGFIPLTWLRDMEPAPEDGYQQFLRKLNTALRVVYELCMFLAVWVVAYQIMLLKHDLQILYESATTGVSTAAIEEIRNASGGMWAFSEGIVVLYLVVLLYLLWPICFNVVAQLLRRAAGRRRSSE